MEEIRNQILSQVDNESMKPFKQDTFDQQPDKNDGYIRQEENIIIKPKAKFTYVEDYGTQKMMRQYPRYERAEDIVKRSPGKSRDDDLNQSLHFSDGGEYKYQPEQHIATVISSSQFCRPFIVLSKNNGMEMYDPGEGAEGPLLDTAMIKMDVLNALEAKNPIVDTYRVYEQLALNAQEFILGRESFNKVEEDNYGKIFISHKYGKLRGSPEKHTQTDEPKMTYVMYDQGFTFPEELRETNLEFVIQDKKNKELLLDMAEELAGPFEQPGSGIEQIEDCQGCIEGLKALDISIEAHQEDSNILELEGAFEDITERMVNFTTRLFRAEVRESPHHFGSVLGNVEVSSNQLGCQRRCLIFVETVHEIVGCPPQGQQYHPVRECGPRKLELCPKR